MSSKVDPSERELLSTLPTKRLLALRDRLLRCEENMAASDKTPDEVDAAFIYFKDDARWSALYGALIAELNTREHVPGGDERKRRRKAAVERKGRRDR